VRNDKRVDSFFVRIPWKEAVVLPGLFSPFFHDVPHAASDLSGGGLEFPYPFGSDPIGYREEFLLKAGRTSAAA
jgi:hypothetical protein